MSDTSKTVARAEELQRVIGKLSTALGNPALRFKSGHIEEAVVDFAIYRIKELGRSVTSGKEVRKALVEALTELRDLMEAVRVGAYKPDTFTNQVANAALKLAEEQK